MESESQLVDASSASLGDQPCSTADTQSTFGVERSLGGAELAAQAGAHATRFINLLRTLAGRGDVWNSEQVPELYRRCHIFEILLQQQITRGCTTLHNLRALKKSRNGISDRASLSRAAHEQYGMLTQLRSTIMLLRSAREKCNNRLIDMKDPDILRISADVQTVQNQIDNLQRDLRASNTGQKEYAHKCYLRSREYLLSRQFQLMEAIAHQTPLRAVVMPDMFVDGQTIAEERVLQEIQLVLNRIEGAIAHWMVEAQEQKPEAAQPGFAVVEPQPTTATSVTPSSHHLLPARELDGETDGGEHLPFSQGALPSSPIAVEAPSPATPKEISDPTPTDDGGASGWRFDVTSWNLADPSLPEIRGVSLQEGVSAAPYAYWRALGWPQIEDDSPVLTPALSRPGSPGSLSESWSTPPSEDWLLVQGPADDPRVSERSSDFCLVDSEGEMNSSFQPVPPKFNQQARLAGPDRIPMLPRGRNQSISGYNDTFYAGSPTVCEDSAPCAENGWGCCDLTSSVHGIAQRPQGFGGLSDVYTALWNSDKATIKVAIKVVRAPSRGRDQGQTLRRLKREILVWKLLQHPYVLPLYGVYSGMGDFPSLVSPWCENGDICTFIASRTGDPDLFRVKLDLLRQTLDGLHYLHSYSPEIVHGDLKGANVLVSDSHRAQLCDFGFSSMKVNKGSSLFESSAAKGTWRWMSPELLSDDNPRHTKASDVWAFGCLLVEVLSGMIPYHEKSNDIPVIIAIAQGKHPSRPADIQDTMWDLMVSCWSRNAHERPAAGSILRRLRYINPDSVV